MVDGDWASRADLFIGTDVPLVPGPGVRHCVAQGGQGQLMDEEAQVGRGWQAKGQLDRSKLEKQQNFLSHHKYFLGP